MQTFVQVVNSGSFSTAARQLNRSKAMVSKQVAALEQHLQARLLNRSTRRLSLTQAGATYYERCLEILDEVETAEAAVSRLQLQPKGRLRVNAPLSFGLLHLAPLLPTFLERHPELELELDYNDRFVDLVNEGYDVAVRVSRQQDSSLHARPLATCRHLVCASPSYLARHGTPQHPADLADHNCLAYSYQPFLQHWRFSDARGAVHQVPVHGRLRANNGEALLTAALAGHGVILSPEFICARALARGELVKLLDGYQAQELMVQAVYPRTRHVSAKVRAFVDFLVDAYRTPSWQQ